MQPPNIRRMSRLMLFLLIIPIMTAQAWGAACNLAPGEPGIVTAVTDGDTLELEDGRVVRLVALQAPKLPLGRPGFRMWPLAPESLDILSAMTLGKRLRLSYGGAPVDRYDRDLAHLHLEDGTWVQGEMLRTGMARFYSFPDNRACSEELLKLEREARAAGRGIWALPYYRIRRHDEAEADIGSFQLVEGTVLETAEVRGRIYLNFGENYRTDFTITIGRRDVPTFRDSGMEPLSLAGKELRVRGWIKKLNGALIEATHPEQIEILNEQAANQ